MLIRSAGGGNSGAKWMSCTAALPRESVEQARYSFPNHHHALSPQLISLMAEEPPIALSVLTVHGDTESTSHDIHLARAPSASGGAADPLFLRDLLTTKADIDVIRQRPRTTRGKGKQVVEFYENQNDVSSQILTASYRRKLQG